MKKTNKPKMGPLGTPLGNPLGYFNSQKAKRSVEPKQKLRKAQDGIAAGPFEKGTSEYLDAKYPGTAMKFRGPVDPEWEADQRDKVANPQSFGWNRISDLEKWDREREEAGLRTPGWLNEPTGLSKDDAYKKGGSVKKTASVKRKK
jgi:hypothetical protein